MDRNEAKLLMRRELEEQIIGDMRTRKMFPIGERLLSADDLMAEVEADTDLGKFLLDDFISFKSGTSSDEDPTGTERAHAVALMEADLKVAPEGWSDSVIFESDGKSWTPNQVMKEVRDGTEFGNRFVLTYLTNHQMLETLLGTGYDQVGGGLFDLPPTGSKGNDQAN